MKILVVGYFDLFATTKPLTEMLIGLQARGMEIHLCSPKNGPVVDHLIENGITVYDHHPTKKIDRESIKFVQELIDKLKPDILFLLNSKSIPNGIRAAKGRKLKIVTYRGAAGLYWHDPTAYLTHLHPRVDGIVCVSRFVERSVRKQFFLRKPATRVIPHGFKTEWYNHPTSESIFDFKVEQGDIIIGCIANNRPVKGIKYLLEATQAFVDREEVKFIIVGKGIQEEVDRLEKRGGNVSKIYAPGFVDDLNPYYKKFDIYVQPSLMEGLGKSIAECMSNAVPVIATHSGGPQELIENRVSGLLVDVKSSDQIEQALNELIDSKSLRRVIGENGKRRIEQEFSIDSMIERYQKFFHDICSN